jgi:hypothetical protein
MHVCRHRHVHEGQGNGWEGKGLPNGGVRGPGMQQGAEGGEGAGARGVRGERAFRLGEVFSLQHSVQQQKLRLQLHAEASVRPPARTEVCQVASSRAVSTGGSLCETALCVDWKSRKKWKMD